jgi:mannose-6-phosphate isomerase-like protein (cupin superfamily)
MSFKDFLKEQEEESKETGIIVDIEKDTVENDNFRKVIFTADNMQLVLMSLKPDEDIGEEVHETIDQFFRIDKGSGKLIMNGKESEISDGFAFIVPKGTKHNVVAGKEGLKIYSIYSPPNHPEGTIHKTKEESKSEESENEVTGE